MAAITPQEKYHVGNPVVRFLLHRFLDRIESALADAAPSTLLDVGCGEGELYRRGLLPKTARLVSLDLRPEALALFRGHAPQANLLSASIYALPFADRSQDTVLCMEVLEHLDHPARALAELARVARQHVILSVPYEPYFQAGNLLRGKYLADLGNHPEHVQHWNPRTFAALLRPVFPDVEVREAFPWLIARCRIR